MAVLLLMFCVLPAIGSAAGAIVAEGGRGGDQVYTEGGDAATGGDGRAQPQPHLILLVADDLGWNDVPWNNKAVKAPHMEALAREGVILEKSYVQPICTPTRSALLSGRYPFTIGRQHDVLRNPTPTGLDLGLTLLPEMLKEQGYSTHIVGKWHLGFCSWNYTPTERGFDTFYGFYNGMEDHYTHKIADAVTGVPWLDLRNNTTPDRSKTGVYSTDLFASRVEELLARDPLQPMFLYLPFQSVHEPLQVPDKYLKPYTDVKDLNRRKKLGMVSAMDEAIGRVVTALKKTNHYNNSIIIFTTDNGAPTVTAGNNWPLRGNKSTLWEGGTRGAAFVHSPFLPNPGTFNPALIHVTDWFPTLLERAGGVAPKGVDGVNQWGAITGEEASQRSLMVYNIDNTTEFIAGIRMGKYKLLVGNPGPGERTPPPEGIPVIPKEGQSHSEHSTFPSLTPSDGDYERQKIELSGKNDTEVRLYDLNSDPLEQHNLAATHTQVVRMMMTLLKTYMIQYKPADIPEKVPEVNPDNFGQVFSPGWC